MDLFKKLRKGMSVLLVACMIAGMVFNTNAEPVYADEPSGTVTTGQGSNLKNRSTDGQESEPTVAANDISQLTAIELFKTEVPVGSKLTVAGYDTHVLSISKTDNKFNLSLAIKHGDTSAAWAGAVEAANSELYSTGIFTANAAPDEYTPNADAGSDDIEFYNVTNQMFSVEDITNSGDAITALEKPYWLGSEVVGTKDGKKYSVAAYVTADGSIDIADKSASDKNVYVKTNTEKVKYIYSSADMENVSDWTFASQEAASESGSTEYATFYDAITEGAGVELTKYTGSVSNEVYNLVGKTSITATCPADADKVLVAVLNTAGEVVAYNVVDVTNSAIDTTVPDVVGSGSLKMIAFSSADGAVKGESEYTINVAAQQDLVVKLADAVDGKLDLALDFKDNAETADGSNKANSEAVIKLDVTESNYYANPESTDAFVLSTAANAEDVTNDNKVTSVQISSYENSTLKVTSGTNFTETEMSVFAGEKNVYLYYYNNNVLTLAGNINIARQYTSEFAYDNTVNEYTYGAISKDLSDTTHANDNLAMDIVGSKLNGVSEFVESVSNATTNTTVADLVWSSRNTETEGVITQFTYTNSDSAETRVNEAINVGTYKTVSHDVAAMVYTSDSGLTFAEGAADAETEASEVFRFIIRNTAERSFSIVSRDITLTTKDQTVKDTETLSSDAVNVEITDANGAYTLTYGDEITVKLMADADKNITFSNLSDSDKEYKIVNGDTDVTYNYNVTLSTTYGKLITTSLSAKLYADGSTDELTATEEGSEPIYTVTYDGEAHSVAATPGTISDAADAEFEESTEAAVTYEWKLDNPSEANVKTADFTSTDTTVPTFTDAGKYLVKYTVSSEGYKDYVGYYYVEIEKQAVTVTIADQTYQYTNEAGQSYFKQFGDSDNLVSQTGLLDGDSITEITLVPVLADGEITGSGKITADVNTVKVTAGEVDKTNNYAITIVDGTLTVEKAVVTVEIADVSGEYKGSAYTVNPVISATYNNGATGIDATKVTVYYGLTSDKSSFTTELPDLTNAGERTVYYYAEAEGYTSDEVKSFSVNITKKTLEISLQNQSVTYPGDITAAFDTSENGQLVVSVTGLIDGHAVSGKIAKTVGTPDNDSIYEAGTLSVAKKTGEDTLDVTVLAGNADVTANYDISDNSTATYTIAKNTFTDVQVKAEPYSAAYDSALHNAVTVTPDAEVFDSTNDKIYYCLFTGEEFNEDTSIGSIKDTSENAEDKVWSESVPQIKTAGEYVVAYKIVKTGYNDYIASVSAEIAKADLALYVAPQNVNVQELVLKTDADNSATYVTPIGLAGDDKIDSVEFYSEELANSQDGTVTNGTIDVKTNEDGTRAVVVKNGDDDVTSNYNITSVGNSLTVKKGKLTVSAESKEVTYDANDHSILELLTINGKPAKEAMAADDSIVVECSTDGITYDSLENHKLTTPGTLNLYYKVTAKGYNDYESSTPVTLTVNKKPLSITIPDQETTYGEAFDAKGYTIDETALLEGHTLNTDEFVLTVDPFENGAATGTTVIKNNGKIKITASDNTDVTDCYELTQETEASYTVNEAEFTDDMLSISVNNVTETGLAITKDYKAEAYNVAVTSDNSLAGYKVTYSIDGGEAADSLSLINAGTYNVKATVSATGYAAKEVDFTFTINTQEINIVLAPQTITYGDNIAQPEGNYGNSTSSDSIFTSITGIQGSDTITVSNITEADGKLTLAADDVTVNYANAGCSGNYTIVVDNTAATLTVNKRAVTITAKDQNIKDAEEAVINITKDNAAEYISVTGLCDGDYIAEAVLSKGTEATANGDFTNEYALSVESVTIMNSEDTNVTEKYDITKLTGTLSVESMPVVIEGVTAEYDGTAHGAKVTVADGYSFDLTNATVECDGVTDVTDGTTINVTVSAEGYNDKTAEVTVTVTKKALLIKALEQSDVELNGDILQVGDTTSDGKTAVAVLRGETAGADEVAVAEITGLVSGQSVTGIKLVADTATSGSRPITVNSDNLSITDESGAAAIGNYNITYFDGSVYVNPATIIISRDGEKADNVVNVSHTYDGNSPLGTITTNPSDATLAITVNGTSVDDLEAAKAATADAGKYNVIIRATKDNYATAQTTIIITTAKAEAIDAQPVGIDVIVNGNVSETKTNVYAVQVPTNDYTCYELAMSVTSGGKAVDASNYTIQYSTSGEGNYTDKLELKAAGEYTVYYKVTINKDNFANKNAGDVITGSVAVTVCDHSNATFTKVQNGVYTCDKCGGTVIYSEYKVLGVAATLVDSTDTDNAKISILESNQQLLVGQNNGGYQPESFGPNAEVVLDATSCKTGTNSFMGWYSKADLIQEGLYYSLANATPVSTSLNWIYKADFDMSGQSDSYVAVFRDNVETFTLTAQAPIAEGTVQITVGGVTTDASDTVTKNDIVLGSEVTVTASANDTHKFAYWTNESGTVLSDSVEYTFSIIGDTTVKAVFIENGKVTVNTYSKYGQSLNSQSLTVGDESVKANIIDAPAIVDFVFTGWKLELVKDGTVMTSNEYKLTMTNEDTPQTVVGGEYDSVDAIKAALIEAIADIVKDSANEGCEVKLTALYQEAYKNAFTVTVENGIITNIGDGSSTSVQLTARTAITVQANAAAEGKKFEGWKVNNEIVSYNEVYSFYASDAITLTASYVDNNVEVEVKATTDMTKFAVIDSADTTKNKFSFTSTSTVPEGCTIEKAGLRIWKLTEAVTNVNQLGTPTLEKGLSSTATTYNYTYNVSIKNDSKWVLYLQSFVTYVDANGERSTVAGKYYKVEIQSGSVTEIKPEVVE